MGGHGVSEKVVRRRFHKGIKNFFNLYQSILDSWMLFDNSGSIPRVIAEEESKKIKIHDRNLFSKIVKWAEEK